MTATEQVHIVPNPSPELVRRAKIDPELRGATWGKVMTIYNKDNEKVGVFSPRRVDPSSNVFRMGPLWIMPRHRGKGYASAAIREFFKTRKGAVLVSRDNEDAQRAFKAAGFRYDQPSELPHHDWYINFRPVRESASWLDYRSFLAQLG